VPAIELQVDEVGAKLGDDLASLSVLEPAEEKSDVVGMEPVVEKITPVAISEPVEEHILIKHEQSDLSDLVKEESEASSINEDAPLSPETCVAEEDDRVVPDRTYSSAQVEMIMSDQAEKHRDLVARIEEMKTLLQ
jgi:hypothetical protein